MLKVGVFLQLIQTKIQLYGEIVRGHAIIVAPSGATPDHVQMDIMDKHVVTADYRLLA
jgi:hypothetical protein